jgi:hypothetical protein
MSKIVDTPPQSGTAGVAGRAAPSSVAGGGAAGSDQQDQISCIVFSAAELLAEDFTVVLARYVLNARRSIECKEVKGVILAGSVYSQTFHA